MRIETAAKAVLRPLYTPPRAAVHYVRAIRIARAYAKNHQVARDLFRAEGKTPDPIVPDLSNVGVHTVATRNADGRLSTPADFGDRVRAVAEEVDCRFRSPQGSMFLPPVDRSALPDRTADMDAVKQGLIISQQLKDPLGVPGVETLCAELLPAIERQVFGCYVIVDKVYIYRNLVSRQPPQASWLWHYDNHPTEVLKLMIYLTDVTERTAPLEYLRHRESHKALNFVPRPMLGDSRISPSRVQRYLDNGYEAHKATGPRGTTILFDDNVVHRANIAENAHRDVLVYQLRPTTFRPRARIDRCWTGSFEHVDVNPDPDDYSVRPKTRRFTY